MEQPQQHLIDTNAVIDYLGNKLPRTGNNFLNQIVDTLPQVSVISKIEILGYNAPESSQQLLTEFMDDVIVIGLSDEIVNQTIVIRKAYKIKLPDAIIAATAMSNNLTLVTGNVADFKMIKGLSLINPWDK